jgi:hypothetical protein
LAACGGGGGYDGGGNSPPAAKQAPQIVGLANQTLPQDTSTPGADLPGQRRGFGRDAVTVTRLRPTRRSFPRGSRARRQRCESHVADHSGSRSVRQRDDHDPRRRSRWAVRTAGVGVTVNGVFVSFTSTVIDAFGDAENGEPRSLRGFTFTQDADDTRTRSTVCCSEPMRRLSPMALLAAAVFGTDAGAAVRVYRPDDPSQVVLQLGSSIGRVAAAQLRAASLAAPDDVDAKIRYVDALIAAGARSGNERYYGYASRSCRDARCGQLRLNLRRARLLHTKHEFAACRASARRNSRDRQSHREARLMRAQVRLHLHEPQQALADCTALMPFVDLLTRRRASRRLARRRRLAARTGLLLASAGLSARRGRDPQLGSRRRRGVRCSTRDRERRRTLVSRILRSRSAESLRRITYADWLLSAGRFDEALQVANRGGSLADRARSVLAAATPELSMRSDCSSHGRKPMHAANERICAIAPASS